MNWKYTVAGSFWGLFAWLLTFRISEHINDGVAELLLPVLLTITVFAIYVAVEALNEIQNVRDMYGSLKSKSLEVCKLADKAHRHQRLLMEGTYMALVTAMELGRGSSHEWDKYFVTLFDGFSRITVEELKKVPKGHPLYDQKKFICEAVQKFEEERLKRILDKNFWEEEKFHLRPEHYVRRKKK